MRFSVVFPDDYDADELGKIASAALNTACQRAFRAKSLEELLSTWAHNTWYRAVYKRPSRWCGAPPLWPRPQFCAP